MDDSELKLIARVQDSDFRVLGLPEFIRDPIAIIRRRWRTMLMVLIAGIIATSAYTFLEIEPYYASTATVLVESQQLPKDFVRPTVEDDSFQRINAIVGEVLSRDRLASLAEKHKLYPELRKEIPLNDVVAQMRKDITIEPQKGIGATAKYETARLFAVTYRSSEPDKAAAVANDLASEFSTASIQIRTQQAALATRFLRRQLDSTQKELKEQERKVTEFKEHSRGELPSELPANLSRLDRLQQQRQSLALQIAEAETRLAQLWSDEKISPSESTPEGRLLALRARLAQELGFHTEEHPNVASLRRQIKELEAQIAASEASGTGAAPFSARVAAEQRTIAELKRQLAQAETDIRDLDARVARTPATQEELESLESKASVLQENYLEFLRKVQEAELAESLEAAQQGERVSVLDRAVPPTTPEHTKLKYLAAGLFASFALAGGVGLLFEILDPVAVSADQIESRFDLTLLGSVPRIM